MKHTLSCVLTFIALGFSTPNFASSNLSSPALKTADYAAATYAQATEASLSKLVKFNTVAVENLSATENPEHIGFKNELKQQAKALGLDYTDYGYVVVIGLGKGKERFGIITHGDIQPVDASKWQQSPFELDTTSEPGKLIGRGTEDDKGAISTALYAMKAIKDNNIALNKRIELYVYMAEESDWAPLEAFIANHELPQTNITIDAEYPVVTAEKGWGLLKFAFDKQSIVSQQPYISGFSGGFFASQIPEDASATINNVTPGLIARLTGNTDQFPQVSFSFTETLDNEVSSLKITALGKTAHSSKPEEGVNAIPHLASLLTSVDYQWPNNGAGTLVNFISDNIGLSLTGEQFGEIAYQDDFMGPMTVSPTVIKNNDQQLELHINIRRPRGKDKTQLLNEINAAVASWQKATGAEITSLEHYIGEPFVQTDAPQIPTLMSVFKHYTGIEDIKPIAIGGGTNSRLFPTAVSFGPAMPGKAYTGHTEHEFITREQLILNLKMYTAAFIELAK
ncbi:dipeptidase [Colwellia sp. MEBiC06753]